MKTCTLCKKRKNLKEFNKNRGKPDGLNNICRECNKKESKKYYERNRKEHIANVRERRKEVTEINKRKLREFLSDKKCLDCNCEDWRVLEFDHVKEKKMGISKMISHGYNWKVILKEIKKCEIVCANCHRIRTYERNGSYRINGQ